MDSETWLRTAKATNACVQCGEWYRRGHTCPRMVCEECGKKTAEPSVGPRGSICLRILP